MEIHKKNLLKNHIYDNLSIEMVCLKYHFFFYHANTLQGWWRSQSIMVIKRPSNLLSQSWNEGYFSWQQHQWSERLHLLKNLQNRKRISFIEFHFVSHCFKCIRNYLKFKIREKFFLYIIVKWPIILMMFSVFILEKICSIRVLYKIFSQ